MSYNNYIGRIFVAVDQLLNVICDGDPDTTISARLYYLSRMARFSGQRTYFKVLMGLVDFTFYALEGKGHCKRAIEAGNWNKILQGSDVASGLMGVILFTVCPVLSVLFYTFALINFIVKKFK